MVKKEQQVSAHVLEEIRDQLRDLNQKIDYLIKRPRKSSWASDLLNSNNHDFPN